MSLFLTEELMKTGLRILAVSSLFAIAASAQTPSVAAVVNHYSPLVAAGLPNYGIAQGSMFDIYGANLVANSVGEDPSKGLPATANGVTVNATVNGTTTHPFIYTLFHGNPDLITVVLPSNTPIGTGTLTVTTAAGTSAAFPLVVLQSGFGILSISGYGTGLGVAQDPSKNASYPLVTLTSSAKPGDVLVLWGTGLGPVTQDESKLQQQQDFGSNYPIEVDVAGVPASIAYHGRSVFPGLDEVIITVPAGVSGCNNSVVVISKNNKIVSNTVTLPVAADGGICSDPASLGVTSTVLSKCATNGCNLGGISILKTTVTTQTISVGGITVPGQTTTTDSIGAYFYKYTPADIATGAFYGPSATSIGSCSVYTFTGSQSTAVPTGASATPLSAGTITATTPSTTATMPFQNGGYSASSSTGALVPSTGGKFTFTNTGADIGAFSNATITLGAPLVWTAPPTQVSRASALTVNWTGGTADTTVVISGYSVAPVGNSTTTFVGGYFWCSAPVAAKTFTIPQSVLLAIPPSGSISSGGFSIPLNGGLSLGNQSNYQAFTAPNLDYGYIGGAYTTTVSVPYN
jgi:uncharacterized protein (TIGR03437 family)